MNASLKSCRSLLLISAALLVVVAIVVATGVIPPVRTDTFPQAKPRNATIGFGVSAVLHLLAAAAIAIVALRATGRSRRVIAAIVVPGVFALLLGLALADAAFALRAHGPAMRTADVLLFLCAATDLLAAGLALAAASLSPRNLLPGLALLALGLPAGSRAETPTPPKEHASSWMVHRLNDQDLIVALTSIEWGASDRWSVTSR